MDCYKMEPGKSLVRIFNALPDGEEVDVYIGGIPFYKNVKYKDFTPYIFLIKDIHTVDVYKSGTKEILVRASFPLPKDNVFTIGLTGNPGTEQLVFMEESLDYKPVNNQAIARTVNLAPNLSSVNLLYNNNPGINNIEYIDQTSYAYLPPGEYNFTIVNNETNSDVVSDKFMLKAMRIYTLYIIQEGMDKFQLVLSVDGNTYACR